MKIFCRSLVSHMIFLHNFTFYYPFQTPKLSPTCAILIALWPRPWHVSGGVFAQRSKFAKPFKFCKSIQNIVMHINTEKGVSNNTKHSQLALCRSSRHRRKIQCVFGFLTHRHVFGLPQLCLWQWHAPAPRIGLVKELSLWIGSKSLSPRSKPCTSNMYVTLQ